MQAQVQAQVQVKVQVQAQVQVKVQVQAQVHAQVQADLQVQAELQVQKQLETQMHAASCVEKEGTLQCIEQRIDRTTLHAMFWLLGRGAHTFQTRLMHKMQKRR